WAKPRVGRIRAWMAVRAARSSVAVQESLAPRVSAMLAATARRLDPPRSRSSRRWPKVLAGTALLAAGAAAATAMALRRRPANLAMPATQRPAGRSGVAPASSVLTPSADAERAEKEAEVNGLTRTR